MSLRPIPSLRKPVQRAFAGRLVRMPPEPAPHSFMGWRLREPITVDLVLLRTGSSETIILFKSKSALRSERYRAKKKQQDPQFNHKEAKRKATERAEIDRVEQIEKILKSNPDPLFVMAQADEEKGLLVTGGYDTSKIEIVTAENNAARNGRRVVPKGFGSQQIENTPRNELPPEYEESFVEAAFLLFRNPREVRLLHQFIYQNTRKSPMLTCLLCKDERGRYQQIGTGEDPGRNIEDGFHHFRDKHPEHFQIFLGRLKKMACMEDHDGMVRRHGGGALKVQCKRCRKILYKPPKGAFGQSIKPAA